MVTYSTSPGLRWETEPGGSDANRINAPGYSVVILGTVNYAECEADFQVMYNDSGGEAVGVEINGRCSN